VRERHLTSETCTSCPADCVGAGAVCGNGVCEAGSGESCVTCPTDCNGVQSGKPSSRYCCGFGGSNPIGCNAAKCGACTTQAVSTCCGDGFCGGDESTSTCLRDCPPCTDADGDGLARHKATCNDANPTSADAVELCTRRRRQLQRAHRLQRPRPARPARPAPRARRSRIVHAERPVLPGSCGGEANRKA
jgi:hypothetical protein